MQDYDNNCDSFFNNYRDNCKLTLAVELIYISNISDSVFAEDCMATNKVSKAGPALGN